MAQAATLSNEPFDLNAFTKLFARGEYALGLGVMAGPAAPLLQRFQEGCLSLGLEGANLGLAGEAAAASGLLAAPGRAAPAVLPPPLPADLLLEWRGPGLEGLLQGLLSRQLIREPLSARYGIGDAQMTMVRRVPFVLRLRPLAQGPFQTGLELVSPNAGVEGESLWILPKYKALYQCRGRALLAHTTSLMGEERSPEQLREVQAYLDTELATC